MTLSSPLRVAVAVHVSRASRSLLQQPVAPSSPLSNRTPAMSDLIVLTSSSASDDAPAPAAATISADGSDDSAQPAAEAATAAAASTGVSSSSSDRTPLERAQMHLQALLDQPITGALPTQSQVYDRVLNANAAGGVEAGVAALCQADVIGRGYYRALYGSPSLCDLIPTDLRKLGVALGIEDNGSPGKWYTLRRIVDIIEKSPLGQLYLSRAATDHASPSVRESDRAASAALAAATRRAIETERQAAAEAKAAAAAAAAAAEAAAAAAARAQAAAAARAATSPNGSMRSLKRKQGDASNEEPKRRKQAAEEARLPSPSQEELDAYYAAAAAACTEHVECVLPPLQDPLQVALQLPNSPPASPTSSAGFVRRSSRAKRPPSPKAIISTIVPAKPAAPVRQSKKARNEAAAKAAAAKATAMTGNKPPAVLLAELESRFPAVNSALKLQLNQDPRKGLCVSAASYIPEHSFVLEYAGDLLTAEESEQIEEDYYKQHTIDAVGCFMFWFKFKRKTYCIDSTCPGPNTVPGTKLPQHLNPNYPFFKPLALPTPAAAAAPAAAATTATADASATAATAPTDASATAASASSATSAAASSNGSAPPVADGSCSTACPPSVAAATPTAALPPPPPPVPLECLGYGYARYINHSRTPNLYARVIDCPSSHIRTNRFDASRRDDERKEHIKRTQQQQQALARKDDHDANGEASAANGVDDDEERKDGGGAADPATAVPAAPSSSCSSSSAPSAPSRPLSSVPLNLHATYPRLCFFASRPISGGEELTIDYGDRDKDSIEQFPWLQ